MDETTARAQAMYGEHPFGEFSYGRASRERSDPHLIAFVANAPADAMLYDIGCGAGFWFETYQRLGVDAERIVGLDLAETNVRNLTKRGYDVRQGSVLDLPLDDNVADRTLCYGVIMVTSAPEKAFAELVRITKPGGELFVGVYNRWHPYFWLVYKFTAPLRYAYWNWTKRAADLVYPFFWVFFQLITRITMGRFMDNRSCRTTFMDQVLTPTAKLYGKADLRRFAHDCGCEVVSLGYSRLYAMLSGTFRKPRPTAAGHAATLDGEAK